MRKVISNSLDSIKIWLAPMEGVVDHTLRHFWTEIGGYDQCVTEFIRVTNHPLPRETFLRYAPELRNNGCTEFQTPVRVQLLGSDIENLCASALTALSMGSLGIDLNFGCPAPSVNRHDGGASLLKSPQRLYDIVSSIRKSIGPDHHLSAKMRLGYESPELCLENAQAISSGGANTLTLHCRTKVQMYKPPVDWTWAGKIKAKLPLQVVVNGDIWDRECAQQCLLETGCDQLMIGRSALRNPWLAHEIKDQPIEKNPSIFLSRLFCEMRKQGDRFAAARIKQLLKFQSELLFQKVCRLHDCDEISRVLLTDTETTTTR